MKKNLVVPEKILSRMRKNLVQCYARKSYQSPSGKTEDQKIISCLRNQSYFQDKQDHKHIISKSIGSTCRRVP